MADLSIDVWRFALLFFVLALNAFFVAAEYSLVAVRRTRIQELATAGSKRAAIVQQALNELNQYVSAVQVGVTMCSLAIGWLGESLVSGIISSPLDAVGIQNDQAVETIAFLVGFLVLTYLHVVLGELVPKTAALQRSEPVVLRTILPMRIIMRLLRPLTLILNTSADVVLRIIGVERVSGMHLIHSEEELKMLVSQSSKGGVLEDTEQEMLYNVFDFADKDVAEVMVPRPDVIAFGIDESPAELMRKIVEQPYTRYPVYREQMDDIAGILHVRDLFNASEKFGKDRIQLASLLRPAHVIPESKSLAGLLSDFRRSKSHMALVVDEYGSLSGIVTMEDLLEEIVGEIDDEHDLPDKPLEQISENHLRVDGKYPLDDLTDRIGVSFPTEDYHTVGGFVFGLLGQQPHEGDVVRHESLRLEVTETDGPRIVHVDVFLLDSPRVEAVDGAAETSPNGVVDIEQHHEAQPHADSV